MKSVFILFAMFGVLTSTDAFSSPFDVATKVSLSTLTSKKRYTPFLYVQSYGCRRTTAIHQSSSGSEATPEPAGGALTNATGAKPTSLPEKKRLAALYGATMFTLIDVVTKQIFVKTNITFPSSLAGCAALLVALFSRPYLFNQLQPGATLLAKWLPVLFVPSLITLPLAPSMGSAVELLKIITVVVGGFFFTLSTTAYSVLAARKLARPAGKTEGSAVETEEAAAVVPPASTDANPPKQFSDRTFYGLSLLTASSGVAAATKMPTTQMKAAFMLAHTLFSFVLGTRLPKNKATTFIHPLVTCTTLTWVGMAALGFATRTSFIDMVRAYKTGSLATGAGDILLFLLGPAVVSLAVSMYDRHKLIRDNSFEVGTAIGVSTIGGLFGTASVVRLLQVANPYLRLSLLSRNITSPLAMAIAGMVGADASLAVSMVVVTGLLGANFGASILTAMGITDPVARGLGIGAAAHGLGTAAFSNEKDAFPFAAIAMALTASAATVTVSVPFIRRLLLEIALGW